MVICSFVKYQPAKGWTLF